MSSSPFPGALGTAGAPIATRRPGGAGGRRRGGTGLDEKMGENTGENDGISMKTSNWLGKTSMLNMLGVFFLDFIYGITCCLTGQPTKFDRKTGKTSTLGQLAQHFGGVNVEDI